MSTSGGKRGMTIDAAAKAGLIFPKLAPDTLSRIDAMLGVGSEADNPLDAGFAANVDQEVFVSCVTALIEDPAIDVVLLESELSRGEDIGILQRFLTRIDELAATWEKPVVCYSVATFGFTEHTRAARRNFKNLCYLQGLDHFPNVLAKGLRFHLAGEAPRRPAVSGRRDALHRLLNEAPGVVLDEVRSKAILQLYDMPLIDEATAQSAEEAAKIAAGLGFPVVAKIVSADIPHKSDIGGVALNLASESAVREAFDRLVEAAASAGHPQARSVLVGRQADIGAEAVVSAHLDPEVGPVIVFGSGGVAIELYSDYAIAPPFVDEADGLALIERTKARALLGGFRGRPPLDKRAVADVLVKVSQLMTDAEGRIASVEINPLAVTASGAACLDALVVLQTAGGDKRH
jgi:acetyltransferase